MTRQTLIVGNWKMNGSAAHVDSFCEALTDSSIPRSAELAVCVPFVYIPRAVAALAGSRIATGSQDISEQKESGAFTGEVSGEMLRDCGARFAIVGHSERRARHGETDELVAAKANAAYTLALTPIVCLGESLAQREAGETETVLAAQVAALTGACSASTLGHMVLAYEPIWAIGSGRSATPEQAQAVHAFLRARLAEWDAATAESTPILYGGSVKPDNVGLLAVGDDVDGALVGGASLQPEPFLKIANAFE